MYQSTIFGTSVRPRAPPRQSRARSARSPTETVELKSPARPCHPNDAALSPALVAALECLPHHIDVTNALEAVVDTATRHLDQVINDVVDLAGVHKVRHAKLGRQFFFVGIEVDANNAAGSDQLGALNHVEANATQTEDGDGGTGSTFIVKATAPMPVVTPQPM